MHVGLCRYRRHACPLLQAQHFLSHSRADIKSKPQTIYLQLYYNIALSNVPKMLFRRPLDGQRYWHGDPRRDRLAEIVPDRPSQADYAGRPIIDNCRP